jgi:hypothetical protein
LAIYLTVLGFNLAGDGLRDTTARSAARSAASSRSRPRLEPEPPQMIVTDLQGHCAHAAAFGALEGQTLEEAWTLVEATPGAPRLMINLPLLPTRRG